MSTTCWDDRPMKTIMWFKKLKARKCFHPIPTQDRRGLSCSVFKIGVWEPSAKIDQFGKCSQCCILEDFKNHHLFLDLFASLVGDQKVNSSFFSESVRVFPGKCFLDLSGLPIRVFHLLHLRLFLEALLVFWC